MAGSDQVLYYGAFTQEYSFALNREDNALGMLGKCLPFQRLTGAFLQTCSPSGHYHMLPLSILDVARKPLVTFS